MGTLGEVLDEAEGQLKACRAIEHPHAGKERYDAEELLAFALNRNDRDFDLDEEVGELAFRRFRSLLARRLKGEPVAYITGYTWFDGLRLEVGPGAFIPRESSEFMVEQAARRLRRRPRPTHVDLATGVGPVAIAVAHRVPKARVFGVDIADGALVRARWNARKLDVRNVRFLKGDLFQPLGDDLMRQIDVVTIHPPYVPKREVRLLPDEIRKFEPVESLTDGSQKGMGLLERVVEESPAWLRRGGWLLVEVSTDRARTVAALLRRGGFREVQSTKGGVAVTRVVLGHT